MTKPKAKITSASSATTSPTSAPRSYADKDVLLDVDELAVSFGTEVALEHISFCVHRGEFIGLIGPNGAGKTTLLRSLLGLQAARGSISMPHEHRLGYVPQRGAVGHGQVPVSVQEVVLLGAQGDREQAGQALHDVHMQDQAGKRCGDLAGGQQQRLLIAKALAGQADLLILDEPTTGIDEQSQRSFFELLQNLHSRGMAIVMVSHDIDSVLRQVTRVMCLNRTLVYDGPADHFEADKYLPDAYGAQHRLLHHQHEGDAHD